LERDKPSSLRTKFAWFWSLATLSFLGVLILEFSFDLSKETRLYRLAIGLDFAVVLGFLAYLAYGAYLMRTQFWAFVQQERVNLALLILVTPALFAPRLAAAIIIARSLVGAGFNILYTPLGTRLISYLNLRPSQTLSLSFVGIIAIGTVLLMFPAATVDGKGTPFLEAVFMATSAACVVGMSVVDVGSYFSLFGQGVILVIIQIGGLGIMVMSASFALMMGSRLRSRTHSSLSELFDVSTPEGIKNLIKAVAISTLVAEIVGAFFLFLAFSDQIEFFGTRLWWSIFHSISAFCNAGFGLASNSLSVWAEDVYVCSIIMVLITIGGIGFFVISDLANPAVYEVKRLGAIWQRLQIQTKVALLSTVLLNSFGLLFFLFLEYDGALLGLSIPGKILASLFQSVSLRTAGFFTVPHGLLAPGTVLFMMVWMFVGANPGSTGGGIKTTTATVAVMAMRAMLLGREEVELFGRRISSAVVSRSLSIIFVAFSIVVGFLMILLATQPLPFERLAFEAVAAFATVGLSMDITSQLNDVGRVCLILLMFAGRIGPLTLAMAIGERTRSRQYSLPEGRIAVG
jgi:trk system potassium uptake protein TrkH